MREGGVFGREGARVVVGWVMGRVPSEGDDDDDDAMAKSGYSYVCVC
jgi:hypothetical protein